MRHEFTFVTHQYSSVMENKKRTIDWTKFGLSSDRNLSERTRLRDSALEEGYYGAEGEELFSNEKGDKPWWLSSLLLNERTLFGPWEGVFTSCLVNLLGVIVFLRSGWVVAQAGIMLGAFVMILSVLVVATSVLSAVGIVARTRVESGGIYFLISHVLGSRAGGAIGLIYCFGQAVGISLCVVGFGESMADLLGIEGEWSERALGSGALLLLAVINIAGVKWVIKLQVVLLALLILALADFVIGSFIHHPPDDGVTGWSIETWKNNTGTQYTEDNSWFTVFGVFFPAVTGCMAGINMSGDLRNPTRDIPVGTLSGLVFSIFVFVTFVVVLGGTVSREVLLVDSMITEKVSATGILLLIGLYTSTLASTLASLYGTPRVLQSIASENVIPFMAPLQMGKGPNKLPILSLVVIVIINLAFLLGRLNTLAPIVTMPFLATYAAIDYAYFALAVTYDFNATGHVQSSLLTNQASNSLTGQTDLDRLFPERVTHKKVITKSTQSSESTSPTDSQPPQTSPNKERNEIIQDDCFIGEGGKGENELLNANHPTGLNIKQKQSEWYLRLNNRWISLIGAIVKVIMMIAIHWIYGLVTIVSTLVLYYYIGRAAPGVPPGIAVNFKLLNWVKKSFLKCIGRSTDEYDEVVVAPLHPGVEVTASQITQENLDFASRSKYHQVKTSKTFGSID